MNLENSPLSEKARQFVASCLPSPCLTRLEIDEICHRKNISLSSVQLNALLLLGGLQYHSKVAFGAAYFETTFFIEWCDEGGSGQVAYELKTGEFGIGYCIVDEAFEPEGLWLFPDGSLRGGSSSLTTPVVYESLYHVIERDALVHESGMAYQGVCNVDEDTSVEMLVKLAAWEVYEPASDSENVVFYGSGTIAVWQRWYSWYTWYPAPPEVGRGTPVRIFSYDSAEVNAVRYRLTSVLVDIESL